MVLDHYNPPFHTHKKSKNLSLKNTNTIRIYLLKFSKVFLVIIFQLVIIHYIYQSPSKPSSSSSSIHQDTTHQIPAPKSDDRCKHGTVYVYDLPAKFNQDLLDNCADLDPWHSRCKAVSNHGLGPMASGLSSAVPENLSPAWYWTDMFAGEVLYHSRMLRHACRTTDPDTATAFYIPFYAGLTVGRYLFTNYSAHDRDASCAELLRWVGDQPQWRRSRGSDHFIMLGRMTWDFRRSRDGDWGSGFIYMPQMKHVLRLGVERDPWDPLEVSVPYPTGFHPRSDRELVQWMEYVRTVNRTSRFAFVGGKRQMKGDFRTILQDHCRDESSSCRVVDCSGTRCYDGTSEIMEAFLASEFCLQPRGDAHTRRSTFDCMLAGSIPVFFWKRSIYNQYEWFLGDEPDRFSVFIDRRAVRNGTTSIRTVLESFSRDEVRRKREKLISLMPKFVYSSGEDGTAKDAFDFAIDGVLRRLNKRGESTT